MIFYALSMVLYPFATVGSIVALLCNYHVFEMTSAPHQWLNRAMAILDIVSIVMCLSVLFYLLCLSVLCVKCVSRSVGNSSDAPPFYTTSTEPNIVPAESDVQPTQEQDTTTATSVRQVPVVIITPASPVPSTKSLKSLKLRKELLQEL